MSSAIENIPVYIKMNILNMLSLKDLLSIGTTCKKMNMFIKKKQIMDWNIMISPKI